MIDFNRHACFKSNLDKLTALRGMMKQATQPRKVRYALSEDNAKQPYSKDIRLFSQDLAIATAGTAKPFVGFQA